VWALLYYARSGDHRNTPLPECRLTTADSTAASITSCVASVACVACVVPAVLFIHGTGFETNHNRCTNLLCFSLCNGISFPNRYAKCISPSLTFSIIHLYLMSMDRVVAGLRGLRTFARALALSVNSIIGFGCLYPASLSS
jgi:hypothetical protein